eukprot:1419834-Prymnesium_polylepis.1
MRRGSGRRSAARGGEGRAARGGKGRAARGGEGARGALVLRLGREEDIHSRAVELQHADGSDGGAPECGRLSPSVRVWRACAKPGPRRWQTGPPRRGGRAGCARR